MKSHTKYDVWRIVTAFAAPNFAWYYCDRCSFTQTDSIFLPRDVNPPVNGQSLQWQWTYLVHKRVACHSAHNCVCVPLYCLYDYWHISLWSRPTISWTAMQCLRHWRISDLQPTWCAPVASRNCRRPSPWWHYIGFIAVSIQKETENSLISAILSGHYFVVCYGFFVAIVVIEVILLRPR